ncbi:methyl-accepting chemotaxis protein [Oxalobacteraceae bacterium CAVE-383]|nr:methyl-accepting chemotaxis protein [Oxalobacteraceae bacterium CAVE-383]
MFGKMKVGTKLIIGFLLIAIVGAIVAGIGIVNMRKMNAMADRMYNKDLLGLSYVKEANISLVESGRSRSNFLLATTAEERKSSRERTLQYLTAVTTNLEAARPLFGSEKAKELLDKYGKLSQSYNELIKKTLDLAEAEDMHQRSAELSAELVEGRKESNALDDLLEQMTKLKEERAKATSEEAAAMYESSSVLMSGLILCSVLAGVALGLLITRGITRQLGGEPAYAADIAGKIARGDLTTSVTTKDNDTSSMLFAIKTMRDSLTAIVGRVRAGTDTIAVASSQIAAGTLDLSARTEEQAGALEETASSMEELTSTVKHNANNAREATHLATSASEVASKGGAVVSDVVDTMGAINESSRKIVDIIGVIDGIAFQTNILALNAAVEAARAGEQGRGFAIVASEVRNLAQRSAQAAKEIKVLIGDSVSKVDAGAKLVDQAGATMQEVVDSVKRVSDIMTEIEAAGSEQSAGIEQINQAVLQMDHVTQQNAALVEESAAAAESLQHQAAALLQVVSVFQLDAQHELAVAAPKLNTVNVNTAARTLPREKAERATKAEPAAIPAPRKKLAAPVAAATATAPAGEDDWEQF